MQDRRTCLVVRGGIANELRDHETVARVRISCGGETTRTGQIDCWRYGRCLRGSGQSQLL